MPNHILKNISLLIFSAILSFLFALEMVYEFKIYFNQTHWLTYSKLISICFIISSIVSVGIFLVGKKFNHMLEGEHENIKSINSNLENNFLTKTMPIDSNPSNNNIIYDNQNQKNGKFDHNKTASYAGYYIGGVFTFGAYLIVMHIYHLFLS